MGSLRDSAVFGVKWMGVSGILLLILHLVQTSLLAHLLPRDDFGLMGMVLVVIGFAQAFSDLGLSNAIIYRQDIKDDTLSSIYWLNLISGFTIAAVIGSASWKIASFYQDSRLIDPVFLATLTFAISPFGLPFQVLLQRNLKFGCLSVIEVFSSICGVVVGVGLAWVGFGVFSLIWGLLTNTIVKAVLLVFAGWRIWHPRAHFHRGDLKGFFSFGFYQMGERGVNFLSANMDYLLIGRFLGAEVLGVYVLAYRLVIQPLTRLNPILTRVAFPIFSKRQSDDAALCRGYLEVSRLLGFVGFPVLVGLGVTAPIFVPLFLGDGWESTIYLVQILIPVGIWKCLGNPLGSILLAKGRVDIGFKFNFFTFAVYLLAFRCAVEFGIFAVAGVYTILGALVFGVGQAILKSSIGLGFAIYFSAIIRWLTMSLVMGFIVFFAEKYLNNWIFDQLYLQISLTILGIFVYGLLGVVFESKFLKELWKWIALYRKEI